VLKRGSVAAQQIVCCIELEEWDRATHLLATHTFHRWELEFGMRRVYLDAYLGRGTARFDRGDFAGARADFEQALEYPMNLRIGRPAKPADARAQWCAAAACEALADMPAARAHWEAAAAEGYHEAGSEAAVYRALALVKLGGEAEADRLLSESVGLLRSRASAAPDDAGAHMLLGLALRASGLARPQSAAGLRQEAEATLRRALELDPRLRRAPRLLERGTIL
jgi:tetratricopeptide (TPR) repeat protein